MEKQEVNPRTFWDDKIISWENDRYVSHDKAETWLERVASRASDSLRFRLRATGEILSQHVAGKHVLELGCGSGFLAARLISAGAASYTGMDISEIAIANARRLAEGSEFADQIDFEVGSIAEMPTTNGGLVFSLGLLDWLTDDELDRMFAATKGADFLHAIAEKRPSISQWLHRAYVQISYGHRTGQYRPRYFSVPEIEAMFRRYSDKPIKVFRDSRLSFGALLTTFDFNHELVENEASDSMC